MTYITDRNAGGIAVPIYKNYSSNDYEYILNDYKPTLVIVSNNTQFKKIKKYIDLDTQKIISFEEIEVKSLLITNILNRENYKKEINKNRDLAKENSNKTASDKKKKPLIKSKEILSNDTKKTINTTGICDEIKDCDIDTITELLIQKGRNKPFPDITTN